MEKIYKQLKKALLLAMAFTLLLSAGIVAAASGSKTPLKTLQVTETNKKVTKYTLYTNGSTAVVDEESAKEQLSNYSGGYTKMDAKEEVLFDVTAQVKGGQESLTYTVSSNNQKVASVVKADGGKKIKVTAKGNGVATITLKDKYSKKKATLKITVKTLVSDIAFANVTGNELKVGVKGSLSLGTFINADDLAASSAKLTYTSSDKRVAAVNAKGVVTGKKAGEVTIRVSAKDQACTYRDSRGRNKKANIGWTKTIKVTVSPAASGTIISQETIKKITLKTNATSPAHTHQFKVTGSDVTFTSSKPTVATVDSEGLITAVGKGSAKITAIRADGTKPKGKAVTLSVKVVTDPDVINVPDNTIVVPVKKTVKIGATVDKAANNNKKLVYEVTEGAQFLGNVKNGKLTSGSVKGKAAGNAVIRITSKGADWDGIPRLVRVTVVDPLAKNALKNGISVKKVNGKGEEFGSAGDKPAKFKLYVGAEGSGYNEAQLVLGEALKGKVSFTSNKPAIASVDRDGKITAWSKGTAKITATATDGSKQKTAITVNVVQLVDTINIANAKSTNKPGEVELEIWDGTKKAALNITTNANAYKKNLKAVTLKGNLTDGASLRNNTVILGSAANEEDVYGIGTVEVTANTGLLTKDQEDFTKTVTINVKVRKEASYYAAEYLTLKKGETAALQEVLADAQKQKALKWSVSSGKGVVSVNKSGVVTGKKADKTATVTGGNTKFEIRVTQSQADFVKDLDAKVKALAAAEDYTVWAGMKPAFNAKTSTLQLTAKNLGKLHFQLTEDSLNKEGLIEAAKDSVGDELEAVFTGIMETILEDDYTKVEISSGGLTWTVGAAKGALVVQKDGSDVASHPIAPDRVAAAKDAAKSLAKAMAKDAGAWAGKDLTVELTKTVPAEGNYPAKDYTKEYTVHFMPVAYAEVDGLIDTTIADEMGLFKSKNNREKTGIYDMNYYPVSNLTVVDVYDTAKNIDELVKAGEDAAESKGLTVEMLRRIKNKMQAADIFVESANLTVIKGDTQRLIEELKTEGKLTNVDVTDRLKDKEITGLDLVGVINKLRAELGAEAVQTYGDLIGGMFTVRAAGTLNGMAFTEEYHIIVREAEETIADQVDLPAIDKAMDGKIAEAVKGVQTAASGDAGSPIGKVVYAEDKNEATVSITNDGTDKYGESLSGKKLGTFVNAILNLDKANKDAALKAEISMDGKTNSLDQPLATDDEKGISEFLAAFGLNNNSKLGELIDKKVEVKVYYSKNAYLVYTIVFDKYAEEVKQPDTPTPDNPTPDTPNPDDPKTDEPKTDDPTVQTPAEVTEPDDALEVPVEEEVSEPDVSAEKPDDAAEVVEKPADNLDETPVFENADVSEAA